MQDDSVALMAAPKPSTAPEKKSNRKAIPPQSSAAEKPHTPKLRGKAKLISSKVVYEGKVFSVHADTIVEPGATKPETRDVIHHSGSVVILAVDETSNPEDPTVILIRQYRHAAGQFLLELPAGRINPGEAPLAAAKREMIEETGFRAKRWTLLTKYFASPGFLGEWMQIYLAQDIREGTATPEEDEHFELVRTPLSHAMDLIANNKIHDGKTLIGLSLFQAQRTRSAAK